MLKAQSLSCRRGRRLVFRDIGFSLEAGGILLVTGRNGSGKSSLLRLMAGLLTAYAGDLFWMGEPVGDFAAHRARLRYLGHLDAVKPELTAGEMVRYWQALYREPVMPHMGLLESFGLENLHDRPVRHLSAGQKRRLALTRLMIGKAPLWLLDEPATSLDSKGQDILTALIARHRGEGGLVMLAAHHAMDFAGAEKLSLDGAEA